jgi:hypothetical protein
MRRWLVPAAVAIAIVALFAGIRIFALDASTDGAGGDAAVGSGAEAPADGSGAGGATGKRDGTATGDGSGDGDPPGRRDGSATNPRGVRIDSYRVRPGSGGRVLAVDYTIGVPACYGTIDRPVVAESKDRVEITLNRMPPKRSPRVACIDIALLKSVDVELEAPLAGRPVLDGSFDSAVVRPGPSALVDHAQ